MELGLGLGLGFGLGLELGLGLGLGLGFGFGSPPAQHVPTTTTYLRRSTSGPKRRLITPTKF